MSIELGILLAVVAGALGLATFFVGRQSAAKSSGKEWGELQTDIKYIKSDISSIKDSVGENLKTTAAAIEKEENERKQLEQWTRESLQRIHERINEHISRQHNIPFPPTE